MRKTVLITILIIACTTGFAQNSEQYIEKRPLNSFSINLLGDASIFSINYERQFFIGSIFILTGKLGLGFSEEPHLCSSEELCLPSIDYLTIPHHITGNLGKGNYFFEFGIGGTSITGHEMQFYVFYPIVGFRVLPLNSGKF